MGDGWETRRRREPGNDWIIIKLATKGSIKEIEIDTAHFKGNYPDQASVQVSNFDENNGLEEMINDSENWKYILKKSKLQNRIRIQLAAAVSRIILKHIYNNKLFASYSPTNLDEDCPHFHHFYILNSLSVLANRFHV